MTTYNCSASQEIPRFLWSPQRLYRIVSTRPSWARLFQCKLQHLLFKRILILIIPKRLSFTHGPLPSGFPTKNLHEILVYPTTFYLLVSSASYSRKHSGLFCPPPHHLPSNIQFTQININFTVTSSSNLATVIILWCLEGQESCRGSRGDALLCSPQMSYKNES